MGKGRVGTKTQKADCCLGNRFQQGFAVLIHVRGIRLVDSKGCGRIGGAYCWQYVASKDRVQAEIAAIDALRRDRVFKEHVPNPDDPMVEYIAEEVLPIWVPPDSSGTGLGFYIDTEVNPDSTTAEE